MATSFHLYLKNRQKANGEYPIYLRITNDRKHKYISTGISVLEKHWNSLKESVRASHDNYKTLNEALRQKIKEAETAQSELSVKGYESAKAIRERVKHTQKADIFVYGDALYQEYVNDGKYHPSKSLKVVLKKLEEFEGERSLSFKSITTEKLEKFEKFLRTKYQNNDATIVKNFGHLKKLIRRALKAYIISDDPFKGFEFTKHSQKTDKTKLTFKQIKAIEELELPPGSFDWHVQNAFLFSFYSGGIRFGDICTLKWENVKNDKLSYRMNKNDKPFTTDLNDFQKEILKRYSGEAHEFIFPFLNNHKDYSNGLVLRRAISSKNAIANGKTKPGHETGLKRIAKLAGIDDNISFHIARHSFAQYAVSERGLDVYDLMQTLRHSKIETTQQYLKGLDEELANKAMRKVF